MNIPEDVYPRQKIGRNNLVGHAYSWGINTHVAMLLLENTRSWQGKAPPGKNCCNQHHDCDSTEFIRKFILFNSIDSTASVSECRQFLWSDTMDTRTFCNVRRMKAGRQSGESARRKQVAIRPGLGMPDCVLLSAISDRSVWLEQLSLYSDLAKAGRMRRRGSITERRKKFLSSAKHPHWFWKPPSLLLTGHRQTAKAWRWL